MNSIARDLLSEIEAFRADHGMAETTLGMRAVGDPNLVRQIKAGRDLRMSTIQKVRDFISNSPSQQPRDAGSL